MSQTNCIVLFFASRQIGGGEAYFINLGKAAIAAGMRCVVIDYVDGYVSARIPGAERLTYTETSGADFLDDCIAFVALGSAFDLGSKIRLNPSAKVLFVSIHHHNAIQLGNWGRLFGGMRPATVGKIWPILEPLRFRSVRNFFLGIHHRHGLVYCAPYQRSYDNEYLGIALDSPVVCIPAVRASRPHHNQGPTGDAIVWVSRIASEKTQILKPLIDAMADMRPKRKLIVVGEGPNSNEVRAHARACGVDLEMPGVIAGDELDDFLMRRAYLCVGVGTAAIEMAKAGLPTLVAGLPEGSDGQLAWLNSVPAGDMILTPNSNCQILSLDDAIRQIENKESWKSQAQLCAKVAEQRHGIKSSWAELKNALMRTTLRYDEAVSLFRRSEQPFKAIRFCKMAILSFMRSIGRIGRR